MGATGAALVAPPTSPGGHGTCCCVNACCCVGEELKGVRCTGRGGPPSMR
jgi:hypothetical protein